jgi:hypothetical protein
VVCGTQTEKNYDKENIGYLQYEIRFDTISLTKGPSTGKIGGGPETNEEGGP